ncbi:GntP family permease [Robertkochia solimangrovi]|uniref:GntP family permease n=1 Tax=Robertkochia solimangrovi TaxID=2213046 RepID=UPI00117E1416|nr:gluconate:H+ symporter [Robertkochia solimangrovi]TRZ45390.1 gluconate transporter [Robertkochia solimangrovi]
MIDYQLLFAVLCGITILLLLIIKFRFHAFLALMLAGIVVGLIAGMDSKSIILTIQEGMGSTLGFVATVVGLGAMFGAILESSGGARVIADHFIQKLGVKNASLAMVLSGFIIAIPVFFEVGFILMVPVIYAIQKRTGKSLLLYAIPLLSGLAVTHAFIPPTPGPIAVADIIGVDLGTVIITGLIAGIPAALLSGLYFGKYIGKKIMIEVPFEMKAEKEIDNGTLPGFGIVASIILIPMLLILGNTFVSSGLLSGVPKFLIDFLDIAGHPFGALIIANLIAWYALGIRRKFTAKQLLDITSQAMAPAGLIILITGAGGVFKQFLMNTGAGKMLAETLAESGFPIVLFAFIIAALVRVIQGSATVAMITAAGMVAPIIEPGSISAFGLGCLVTSIASGASIFSHVNDSGFWLVSQYLGLTEKQTFASWSMMTVILAITGLIASFLMFLWA